VDLTCGSCRAGRQRTEKSQIIIQSSSKNFRKKAYKEEHSLLEAFTGQFLQTSLTPKFTTVQDDIIDAHQIALQFNQLDEIFLEFSKEMVLI
jgi:hypothetical protein